MSRQVQDPLSFFFPAHFLSKSPPLDRNEAPLTLTLETLTLETLTLETLTLETLTLETLTLETLDKFVASGGDDVNVSAQRPPEGPRRDLGNLRGPHSR